MSFRLAAYAVCIENGQVLLARHVASAGESTWTLPGVFYQVRITGGRLRPEPDGDIAESVWTAIPDVALVQTTPETGHVAPVPIGGLMQH